MSSLRPLLTILLLAAVGVVLYMKINETEPVIPAGVGEWTAGPLEIGGDAPSGASASTSAPAFAADAAPPFKADAAATAGAAAPADEAPAWTPPAAVSATTPADAPAASDAESSTVARSATPEAAVPAMPAIPDTSATATETKDAAGAADAPSAAATAAVATAAAATAAAAADSADAPAPPAETVAATAPSSEAPAPAAPADAPAEPITPTEPTAEETTAAAKASLFPSVRVAVQAELERGELSQALLRLSEWYGDPSLTPEESKEVETLLSQLAGSVIWEGPPAHRLEPAYVVQAGETLEAVGEKFDVPWQLLAKINGIADPAALQPGQELKVIRGKFSALVDLSERTMTLMLDRRYAGKFAIEIEPTTAIEEGQWKVDQKLLTPASGGVYAQAGAAGEDRSLLLANPSQPGAQAAVLRGPGSSDPASPQPAGRAIHLKSADIGDVYDILSVGSRVTIRR